MQGTYTALITPFKEGDLDEQGLRENIWFQIEEGIDGLLVLGSTGEGNLLSDRERHRVIQIAVEEAKGKVPLWVSGSAPSTSQALQKTEEAQNLGADGVLLMTPYYILPTQEGIARHFETIAQKTHLPIMLYNHPKRSGSSIEINTLKRLAKVENIVGIKDASGNIGYVGEILNAFPNFVVMSGDDISTLAYLSMGAHGVISILSNLMPRKVCELVSNPLQRHFHELFPFIQFSQCETNPIPIKAMMNLIGMPAGECRLPLTPLTSDNRKKMEGLLLAYV